MVGIARVIRWHTDRPFRGRGAGNERTWVRDTGKRSRPGNRKCDASATPAVFVGESARANAKGMNAAETARAGTKGVRQRATSADAVRGFLFGQTSCRKRSSRFARVKRSFRPYDYIPDRPRRSNNATHPAPFPPLSMLPCVGVVASLAIDFHTFYQRR